MEDEKTDETINPEINPDMLRIHAEMSRVISSAEAAGEEGDIDKVQVTSQVVCKGGRGTFIFFDVTRVVYSAYQYVMCRS